MGDIIIWILAFVVAISILVAVHEFGHYIVAKRLGIKVLRFSIGFGKPIWRKVAGADQTEYVIASIPLGGYVKMLDERDCVVSEQDKHRTFNQASIASRLAVLAGGPGFNFLFAILAYWAIFMTGVSELRPVIGEIVPDSLAAEAGLAAGDNILVAGDQKIASWQQATIAIIDDLVDDGIIKLTVADESGASRNVELVTGDDKRRLTEPGELLEGLGIRIWPSTIPARIGVVLEGEAASQAGIRPGDLVLAADDQRIDTWRDWLNYVRANPQQTVTVDVERDGRVVALQMTIGEVIEDGIVIGRIGAGVAEYSDDRRVELRYGPIAALTRSVAQTGEMTAFTIRMLWRMVSGDFSARNLSGPLTIAQYAGETAQVGPRAFLSFLAIVSISLGILNLLPVPILDGGQMVFQIAEAVKGSPLSPETELRGQQLGIVLLLMLMSLAFYNDILRLVG